MRHVCLALTARLSRSSRYLFREPWRCFSSLLPAVTLRTVNPTVSCSGTAPVDSESHNSWQLIPLRETKELCSSVTQHHGVAVPESLFSGLRFKTKEISMRKRTHSMANRRLHQASLLTSNHSKGQRGQARPQTLSDKSVQHPPPSEEPREGEGFEVLPHSQAPNRLGPSEAATRLFNRATLSALKGAADFITCLALTQVLLSPQNPERGFKAARRDRPPFPSLSPCPEGSGGCCLL